MKTKPSHEVFYSKGKNDECYTPDYGVAPIIQYIPKDAVVWCPFDKEHSEFVKQIEANGNKVIRSHIENGQDFYEWEPEEHWDMIVSNPPFTGKRQIFERALSFDKPIALIMSVVWLNDAAPKQVFAEKELQLLLFDKRLHFFRDGEDMGRPTFSSAYFCHDFLPKQIVMGQL